MRHILILLMLMVGGAFPVAAADAFVPEVVFPASQASLADHNIDILGLLPGMSADEAKAALSRLDQYELLKEQPTSFRVEARGVSVVTADTLKSITAGGDGDRIEVSFTGPASDVQVFSIRRAMRYPDVLSAPTLESIAAALEEKYGEPSMRSTDLYPVNPNNPGKWIWAFARGKQVPCGYLQAGSGRGCALLLGSYDPSELQRAAGEQLDFDYVISASVWPQRSDVTKARQFDVVVMDLARRKAAAQADTQALVTELERVHREASKEVAAPSL